MLNIKSSKIPKWKGKRWKESRNKKREGESINLSHLDKLPLSQLLTYSADELFAIQSKTQEELRRVSANLDKTETKLEDAELEHSKAFHRQQWIEDVIELKYKILSIISVSSLTGIGKQ